MAMIQAPGLRASQVQPPIGIDVTTSGAVADGRQAYYIIGWATGAPTAVSFWRYATLTTTVAWGANTQVTTTFNSNGNYSFQPEDVGQPIHLPGCGIAGGDYVGTILTYIDGQNVIVTPAVATNITGVSTKVCWPCLLPSDAGKKIYMSLGGPLLDENYTQGWYVRAPQVNTIAAYVSPNSFTAGTAMAGNGVIGGVSGAEIAWGTDNTAAIAAAGNLAVATERRYLHFPGKGRYCAFDMDNASLWPTLQRTIWLGEESNGFFCNALGQKHARRIAPRFGSAIPEARKLAVGRLHLPRLKSLASGSAAYIVCITDSLGGDNTSSTFETSMWSELVRHVKQANPQLVWQDYNRAIGATGLQDAVATRYTGPASIPVWYTNSALPWFSSFVAVLPIITAGVPSSVTPDIVYIEFGSNDALSFHVPSFIALINKIRALPTRNGFPPDIIVGNSRLRTFADGTYGVSANQNAYEYASCWSRTICQNMGLAFVDYYSRATYARDGVAAIDQAETFVPAPTSQGPITSGQPAPLLYECRDFQATLGLVGANGLAAWTGANNLVQIQLSLKRDNLMNLFLDPNGYINYWAQAWGWTVPTTVSATGPAGTTVTTSGQSSVPATVSIATKGRLLTATTAVFNAGMVGQAIDIPGGQGGTYTSQRTFITGFKNTSNVIVADPSPVTLTNAAVTLTIGGMVFNQSDAAAQADITIAGAGAAGGLYTGKITGWTSNNQVTVSPAIGTTVSGVHDVFVGRISVPPTATQILESAATANVGYVVGVRDNVFMLKALGAKYFDTYRIPVERGGGLFVPCAIPGNPSAPGSLTGWLAVWLGEPVVRRPTVTDLDLHGINDTNSTYAVGGNAGAHPTSRSIVHIDDPVLRAQDFTVA